jgi:hypothetical protein
VTVAVTRSRMPILRTRIGGAVNVAKLPKLLRNQ